MKTVLGIDEKEIAQCVGLWLAEGDRKSQLELTLTNNCESIIKLFHNTIIKIYGGKNKPRIYAYSSNKDAKRIIKNVEIKFYKDVRTSRPYYIYRLADVNFLKEWKELVKNFKQNEKLYPNILQGFFAGEGNIKTGSHHNRTLRISQGKRNSFIEKILNFLRINYRFSERERAYVITSRYNLEKLQKMGVAKLHPEKNKKFQSMMKTYQQRHYSRGELKKKIFEVLDKQYTSEELSIRFNRSQARIQKNLSQLKKENKIKNFRVRSKDYWINNLNVIIISEVKKKYLDNLKIGLKRTAEFSKRFDVCPRSSKRRLEELEKLELVKKNENNEWKIMENQKKVIVI